MTIEHQAQFRLGSQIQLFERLPGLRLDPTQPSSPQGHEFRSLPTLFVRWDKHEKKAIVP